MPWRNKVLSFSTESAHCCLSIRQMFIGRYQMFNSCPARQLTVIEPASQKVPANSKIAWLAHKGHRSGVPDF
jgi:hypothetical protein